MALVFMASALPLLAQPAQIILIRHAEKPDDPENKHLSDAGRERAKHLVSYFKTNAALTRFGPPSAPYATAQAGRGRGQRCQETLQPLADDLKLPLSTPCKAEDYEGLAKLVLNNPEHKGKSVVICWTHQKIPDLAAALGVAPPPKKLGEETYDRVYLITYSDGKAKLAELRQPPIPAKRQSP